MKIRTKLISSFIFITLVFALGTYVTVEVFRIETQNHINKDTLIFADQAIEKIYEKISLRIEEQKLLSESLSITDYVLSSNKDFELNPELYENIAQIDQDWKDGKETIFIQQILENTLSHELQNVVNFYDDGYDRTVFADFYVTNQYGVVIATSLRTSDYLQADEDWYRSATDEHQTIWVEDPEFDTSSSTFSIGIVQNLFDDQGNFIGIFKGALNLQDIKDTIVETQEQSIYDSSSPLLIDRNGLLIFTSTEFSETYTTQDLELSDFGEDLSYRVSVDKALNGETGTLISTINEKETFTVFISPTEKISDYDLGWFIIIDFNSDEIFEPVNTLRNYLILIGISVISVSTIFGVVLSRKISQPILLLKNAMHKVEQGNFSKNILNRSNDEIGDLTGSFQKMSTSLEKILELKTELARADERLKSERFSAIGELSALLVHDIRNPLSIIKACNESLELAKDNPKVFEKMLKRNERAIDRITRQIDNVMDFLKNAKLRLESVSLTDLLNSIISEMNIPDEIKVNLPTNDVITQVDKIKLYSLFSNLITNAIQAMDNKGIITIRISEKSKNNIIIEIENDGPQIPEENVKKIFEPLFTTKQIGTGLGLASCKNTIEQHHGTISVANNPVTFTIMLPKTNAI